VTEGNFHCKGCVKPVTATKSFHESAICYWSNLEPVSTSDSHEVVLALRDLSLGIIETTKRWQITFCSHVHLNAPDCASLTIKSPHRTFVKVSIKKSIKFNTEKNPCLTKDDPRYSENLSQAECTAECHNQVYMEKLGCKIFPLSALSHEKPETFCNHFGAQLPYPKNQSFLNYLDSDDWNEIESEAGQFCFNKCLRKCEETSNSVTLESEFSMADYATYRDIYVSDNEGVGIIYVSINHAAVYEGGIMTWTEIPAYTWVQLVSNFGGALGLFVGGTIMTFAQLILFPLDYIWEKRKKKN
jgi:hypothetical protein